MTAASLQRVYRPAFTFRLNSKAARIQSPQPPYSAKVSEIHEMKGAAQKSMCLDTR